MYNSEDHCCLYHRCLPSISSILSMLTGHALFPPGPRSHLTWAGLRSRRQCCCAEDVVGHLGRGDRVCPRREGGPRRTAMALVHVSARSGSTAIVAGCRGWAVSDYLRPISYRVQCWDRTYCGVWLGRAVLNVIAVLVAVPNQYQ